MTSGYTWVQCSSQTLLYFVADRHSSPGERLLYPKLQTDTLGYSVADGSLYTLSPTDIPVYTLGDRPLYPGLLTDTQCSLQVLVYSDADQYSCILSMRQTTIPWVTD